MDLAIDIQNTLKRYWVPLLCGFIIIYFVFNIFCGNRNIYRLFALQHEIAQAKIQAQTYQKRKVRLQRLVDHLSDQSLDVDLLEERARIVLNVASDEDFIILNDAL